MTAVFKYDKAQEGSSFGIQVEFYDLAADGEPLTPVVPKSDLTWSLLDLKGNVINNRARVPITPQQIITIVLKGDDLLLPGDASEKRRLLIDGSYDSLLGSDLDLRAELEFTVENLSDLPPEP